MAGRSTAERRRTAKAEAEAAPLAAPTDAAPAEASVGAPEEAAPLTAPEPDEDALPEVQETAAAPLDPPAAPATPTVDLPVIPDAPPPPPASLAERPGLDLRYQDGSEVDPEDLFEDPGPRFTYLIVRHRVFERHYYDNATQTADRLLFTPGYRLVRHEAARVLGDVEAFRQAQQ